MNPFNIFVFFSSFIVEFLSLVTDHIYIVTLAQGNTCTCFLSIPLLSFQKSSRNNDAADNSDDDDGDDDEEEDQEVILAFQHSNDNNNNN